MVDFSSVMAGSSGGSSDFVSLDSLVGDSSEVSVSLIGRNDGWWRIMVRHDVMDEGIEEKLHTYDHEIIKRSVTLSELDRGDMVENCEGSFAGIGE